MQNIFPPLQCNLTKSPAKRRVSGKQADMSRVATIILGGGQGTRLFPLTLTRCKPAICFGGRYRLIDVPISNAINAGCQKLFVVTQFLSSSLHQHIFRTYRDDIYSSGFLEILPAEQKPSNRGWFQGTADAVRQNIDYFIETPVEYILILSGDQLYNMDFRRMLKIAEATNADLVLATLPVNEVDARRMGVLKTDEQGTITEFIEKPQTQDLLDKMRLSTAIQKKFKKTHPTCSHLGSMGMYLFKREALLKILHDDPRDDFGNHIIPSMISQGNTVTYIHDGYWEDIGTVESFYRANIALTDSVPSFDCYDASNPIFSCRNNLPGAKIFGTHINHAIICEGSIVEAQEITRSILGPRSVIKKGCIIRDSYVMGSEYYTPPMKMERIPENLSIGQGTVIMNAIIDKQTSIGKNVQLVNSRQLTHYDGPNVYIRDGIIIVPRGATIPDGFIL